MKDNSKLVAIILVIITIIVLIVTFITKKDEKVEQIDPLIVTNYSNFYTVNSCLYRMVTYISTQDKESLMLLLNDEYKKENNITEDNVLNLFPSVNENSTFVSQKMYYNILSGSINKYYVKGYIAEQRIFDDEILEKLENESVYFIVYLDSSKNVFSIEPYDGEVFKVGDTNEE